MLATIALATALALKPCSIPAYGAAQCGWFSVPEDRAHPARRTLHLRFALFRAAHGDHKDAVVPLAGGPGEAALQLLRAYLPVAEFRRIRDKHDVLALDARGRGLSDLVPCPTTDSDPQSLLSEDLFDRTLVERCRLAAEKRADLTKYTDIELSDDLDALRGALGYQTLTLQGASGGTLTSFVYARRFPSRVRAIADEAVAPVYSRVPLHYARAANDGLANLLQDCAGNARCRKAYPHLASDYAAAVRAVRKAPVRARLDPAITRLRANVTLGPAAFSEQIRYFQYDANGLGLLPFLLHAAAQGNWTPFLSAAYANSAPFVDAGPSGISNVVYFSTTCSEGVAFISEAALARETAGTLAGEGRVRPHAEICRHWPHAHLPASFVEPVHGSMPVLLLSGEWDPATIPSDAVRAARDFTNSRLIRFARSGHSLDSACTSRLYAEFIEHPGQVRSIDASCAKEARIDYALTYAEVVKRTRL